MKPIVNPPSTREGLQLNELVRACRSLDWEDLSQAARWRTVQVVADTIGAVLAGARLPEVLRLAAQVPSHGEGAALILVPGFPSSTPAYAAFVNSISAVSLELDEGGDGGHAASHVVPASLAAAQHVDASGPEFLRAVAAGYEVAARAGVTVKWHPAVHGHGHVGTIGAAVAVALLLERDPMAAALIAANLPLATTYAACFDGATVRNVWPGISGQIGFLANDLAQAGFTGSQVSVDDAFGVVLGAVEQDGPVESLFRDDHLMLLRNSFKPYSCCFETHAAVEAAVNLGPLAAGDVEEIVVELSEVQLDQLSNGTALSNRFSIPYVVATGLVHGHARPEAFEPNPEVLELSRRVAVRLADPSGSVGEGGARLTVLGKRGRQQSHVDIPYGTHPRSMSSDDIRGKFMHNAWYPDSEALLERILALGEQESILGLFP